MLPLISITIYLGTARYSLSDRSGKNWDGKGDGKGIVRVGNCYCPRAEVQGCGGWEGWVWRGVVGCGRGEQCCQSPGGLCGGG